MTPQDPLFLQTILTFNWTWSKKKPRVWPVQKSIHGLFFSDKYSFGYLTEIFSYSYYTNYDEKERRSNKLKFEFKDEDPVKVFRTFLLKAQEHGATKIKMNNHMHNYDDCISYDITDPLIAQFLNDHEDLD